MKGTKMAEFNIFWDTYPKDLCNRKGSRKKAEDQWNKLSTEVQDQIVVNLRELIRADRAVKKGGEFVARWPMVTTWLNGELWEDIHDIRQSDSLPVDKRKCSCGEDAAVKNQCYACYEGGSESHKARMQMLYNELLRIGMGIKDGETKQQWHARCRDFARSNMGRALNKGAG
jgi:hypothetical protein